MPYEISWYDPSRIIVLKGSASISDADIQDADNKIHSLLTSSSKDRVHVIIDDAQVERMPGVSTTMKLKALEHPKMGWTVLVGQNDKVNRMMYTITCHLRGLPLYFADSLEEAVTFLAKTEAS